MTQWEFTFIQVGTNAIETLNEQANRLCALGWEPVSVTHSDRSVSFNTLLLTFKRPISHPPEPPASRDEWQPDPTGRHQLRRWTWRGWGAECIDGKDRVIDSPNMHPDAPVGPV